VTHYHVGLATGKSIFELDKLVESKGMGKDDAVMAYAKIYADARGSSDIVLARASVETTLGMAGMINKHSVASWFGDEYALYLTRCEECTKRLMN
jgi:hypothetical protein